MTRITSTPPVQFGYLVGQCRHPRNRANRPDARTLPDFDDDPFESVCHDLFAVEKSRLDGFGKHSSIAANP